MNLSDPASLRRSVYALLIVVAVAGVAGRILGVGRVYEPWLSRDPNSANDTRGNWPPTRPEPMPTHSDNDRSRWATVRALVEKHTYVVGHRDTDSATRTYTDSGIVFEDGWKSIDKVKDPQTDDFYSSKPPLLPTLVAGEYYLFRHFGWSITDERHRWEIVPAILLTFNALPWGVALFLLARLAERHGSTDWGRLFVLAAACFGTFVTTFSVTLNNHTVAAWSAMFALYAAVRVWEDGAAPFYLFPMAGFFAAFTACNELPAASFAVALFLLLLWRAPGYTLAGFVPAALVPVAAFFVTNYLALGTWLPAYEKFGGPWYDYEGSYWHNPKGIDTAGMQEGRAEYAFHLLLGHHGAFSLTPIFLLSLAGMIGLLPYAAPALFGNRKEESASRRGLSLAGLLGLGVTVVVLGFYIMREDRQRNYGGWTSGPRWLLWLTPLWLVALLPAADWLGRRRWGRVAASALLAISVVSVSYPEYSPWRHPWLYNFLEAHGLVKY
ncbi:MAG TPA: hypothetical protein VKA46_21280 [Gemmataceae bacterium]|nr:hypothetical protein [Gemmataceae bacterium]